MRRLFVPTLGPTDWRRLLADPSKQWKREKSACELAVVWEAARETPRGLPPNVEELLDNHERTRGAVLLIGIPEHQVSLPGGGHASQTDLWALLRTEEHLLSMAVEAKSGEKLDELVEGWLRESKHGSGKPARLTFLKERLGLSEKPIDHIRYQLLHRTVSALLEAERFTATIAVLLVQSFGDTEDDSSFADFQTFATLLGTPIVSGRLTEVHVPGQVRLLLGWLDCEPATDSEVAATV
jgi:hypothetical protein